MSGIVIPNKEALQEGLEHASSFCTHSCHVAQNNPLDFPENDKDKLVNFNKVTTSDKIAKQFLNQRPFLLSNFTIFHYKQVPVS